jgi:hypothetical protein
MMDMKKCESCGVSGCGHCSCRCVCHKVIPALVIIYGLIAFYGSWLQLNPQPTPPSPAVQMIIIYSLPIILIIGGLKAMFANKCKCC